MRRSLIAIVGGDSMRSCGIIGACCTARRASTMIVTFGTCGARRWKAIGPLWRRLSEARSTGVLNYNRPYGVYTNTGTRRMRQVITYLRVSTDKQGKSGLGIEAQRDTVARFIAAEGCEALGVY